GVIGPSRTGVSTRGRVRSPALIRLSAPAIGEIHRFITLSFCPRITRMDANKKEFSRRSREAFGVRRRVVALKSFCVYSASSLDMAREEFVELVPLRKP